MRERLENVTKAAELGGTMTKAGTRISLHFRVQFLSLDSLELESSVGCKENVWRRILEKERRMKGKKQGDRESNKSEG